jgi:hypothetical protein
MIPLFQIHLAEAWSYFKTTHLYLEYHISQSQAYTLLILDLFSQFYSYSVPLADIV